jgi:uncharacterized membrane protein YcaP (DUF421 family)
METVVRALCVYVFLLLIFRVAGRRTLGEMSAFELVILLIISETTQQAMIDNDPSMTNAALAITTLVAAGVGLATVKEKWPRLETIVAGRPLLLIANGEVDRGSLKEARVGLDDIMAAARASHGVERLANIKHAVLETGGGISIIPRRG